MPDPRKSDGPAKTAKSKTGPLMLSGESKFDDEKHYRF